MKRRIPRDAVIFGSDNLLGDLLVKISQNLIEGTGDTGWFVEGDNVIGVGHPFTSAALHLQSHSSHRSHLETALGTKDDLGLGTGAKERPSEVVRCFHKDENQGEGRMIKWVCSEMEWICREMEDGMDLTDQMEETRRECVGDGEEGVWWRKGSRSWATPSPEMIE